MSKLSGQIILLLFFSISCAYTLAADLNDKQIRVICEIQERLGRLGFSPGDIDGLVGKKTRDAVSAFLSFVKSQKETNTAQEVLSYLRSYKNDISLVPGETNLSLLKRPSNGQQLPATDSNAIAPLKIKTSAKGYDFFVKLSDDRTEQPVKVIYIHGGSTINTKLPLGKYNMKYVTGKQWYGGNCLFGMDGIYSKADKEFVFYQDENQVSGYSIELILQVDGNLSTIRIDPDNW